MLGPVTAGERYIIVARPIGEGGRRLYADTAIFAHDGAIRVFAKQTCVRVG